MATVGRNEPCPCGSQKKYSDCYLKEAVDCKNFQIDQRKKIGQKHKERDKEVFDFFKEAMEDVGSAFSIHPETKSPVISSRVRLVTTFTFVDVVASYWYEYLGKDGTQRERFLAWIEAYCLTKKNSEWTGDLKRFTSTRLYALRSSLVHFLGLSEQSEGYQIAIAPEEMDVEMVDKLRKKFAEVGKPTLIFKPKAFHNLILRGAELMLGEWSQNISEAQTNEDRKWEHIEGIDRIWTKVNNEGAAQVNWNRPTQASSTRG